MGRYVVRRLLHGLVVVAGVTVVIFAVTRMVSDPATVMLPVDAPEAERIALRERFGLDDPIPEQFVRYVGDVSRGDFGESLWQKRPAMDVVSENLPRTLQLTAAGMGLAIAIALPLGIAAALRPNSLVDRLASTSSLIGLSIPQFWLGLLFILLFAVELDLFPTSGAGSVRHLVLPALTLALPTAGRLSMLIRSTMIDELNRPWVKVARLKGMPFTRVVGSHALRNAAAPLVTLAGWDLARMLAGMTVVVEVVFAWPGLGLTALEAIQRSDLVLLQAVVFVIAVMTVAVNLVVDIVHKRIDPRVSLR